jgi:hypothetical protein
MAHKGFYILIEHGSASTTYREGEFLGTNRYTTMEEVKRALDWQYAGGFDAGDYIVATPSPIPGILEEVGKDGETLTPIVPVLVHKGFLTERAFAGLHLSIWGERGMSFDNPHRWSPDRIREEFDQNPELTLADLGRITGRTFPALKRILMGEA